MKKMTQSEWACKFETEFKPKITKFCLSSDKTILFGNDNITAELKNACSTVVRDHYIVQLEINPVEHVNGPCTTEFLLTDYNKVSFFAAEYIQGFFSIGVMQGHKAVCGHVLNIADYTKDGETTRKLMQIIRYYISLFTSTMDTQHYINSITEIAGKKNI